MEEKFHDKNYLNRKDEGSPVSEIEALRIKRLFFLS